ncbi:MAG TPA: zf-HC2 domain-containing protein [Symbiobacteriaceae bacterium]|jgi:hypothetical protein
MQQCDRIQQDLPSYLKGELPLEYRAGIQRHLSECPACAEEAAAVNEIGHKFHAGLSDWVDQGVCPPELMARIEDSIRAISAEAAHRHRPWYQSWPAMAGAVAAAAVLLVVMGGQLGMRDELAAIPFIGPVATHLFSGGDPNLTGFGLIPLKVGDSHGGIALAVSELEVGKDQTRIHYSLAGRDLDTEADAMSYAPVLQGSRGSITLHTVTVGRKSGELSIDAYFDPVPTGEALAFSISQVPVKMPSGSARRTGPWKATFHS